ncbi:MAG: hydrogenase iron-sulfur subunit [Candidatus Bathyarchaeota archaeon]|nr:MAG: hydrogenase iron-sulfur subunit [Candidatus Bathyarchaeota archaeon]
MMFRPRIIGFVCNWSLPTEVDIASTSRIRGYPKIRIVRVMCIGRIDPVVVLETFAKGADGVLVIGCHPPDCHYIEGNLQAERKIKMLKKLISQTDLESERLRLDWAYASEIDRFAKIINDFRNQVMMLGSSPLAGEKPDKNILAGIMAAKAVAGDSRLRTLVGREKQMIEEGNVYGEKVEQEEFDEVMDESINAEYVRGRIRLLLKDNPMSVEGLSKHLDSDPKKVLRHIVVLRQRGLVALDRIEGKDPLYIALEAV